MIFSDLKPVHTWKKKKSIGPALLELQITASEKSSLFVNTGLTRSVFKGFLAISRKICSQKYLPNKISYYIPRNLLYTINPNVLYERWISGAIFHGHGISQCNEIHLTFEWSNVMFTFLLDTENGENLSNRKKLWAGRKLKQNC